MESPDAGSTSSEEDQANLQSAPKRRKKNPADSPLRWLADYLMQSSNFVTRGMTFIERFNILKDFELASKTYASDSEAGTFSEDDLNTLMEAIDPLACLFPIQVNVQSVTDLLRFTADLIHWSKLFSQNRWLSLSPSMTCSQLPEAISYLKSEQESAQLRLDTNEDQALREKLETLMKLEEAARGLFKSWKTAEPVKRARNLMEGVQTILEGYANCQAVVTSYPKELIECLCCLAREHSSQLPDETLILLARIHFIRAPDLWVFGLPSSKNSMVNLNERLAEFEKDALQMARLDMGRREKSAWLVEYLTAKKLESSDESAEESLRQASHEDEQLVASWPTKCQGENTWAWAVTLAKYVVTAEVIGGRFFKSTRPVIAGFRTAVLHYFTALVTENSDSCKIQEPTPKQVIALHEELKARDYDLKRLIEIQLVRAILDITNRWAVERIVKRLHTLHMEDSLSPENSGSQDEDRQQWLEDMLNLAEDTIDTEFPREHSLKILELGIILLRYYHLIPEKCHITYWLSRHIMDAFQLQEASWNPRSLSPRGLFKVDVDQAKIIFYIRSLFRCTAKHNLCSQRLDSGVSVFQLKSRPRIAVCVFYPSYGFVHVDGKSVPLADYLHEQEVRADAWMLTSDPSQVQAQLANGPAFNPHRAVQDALDVLSRPNGWGMHDKCVKTILKVFKIAFRAALKAKHDFHIQRLDSLPYDSSVNPPPLVALSKLIHQKNYGKTICQFLYLMFTEKKEEHKIRVYEVLNYAQNLTSETSVQLLKGICHWAFIKTDIYALWLLMRVHRSYWLKGGRYFDITRLILETDGFLSNAWSVCKYFEKRARQMPGICIYVRDIPARKESGDAQAWLSAFLRYLAVVVYGEHINHRCGIPSKEHESLFSDEQYSFWATDVTSVVRALHAGSLTSSQTSKSTRLELLLKNLSWSEVVEYLWGFFTNRLESDDIVTSEEGFSWRRTQEGVLDFFTCALWSPSAQLPNSELLSELLKVAGGLDGIKNVLSTKTGESNDYYMFRIAEDGTESGVHNCSLRTYGRAFVSAVEQALAFRKNKLQASWALAYSHRDILLVDSQVSNYVCGSPQTTSSLFGWTSAYSSQGGPLNFVCIVGQPKFKTVGSLPWEPMTVSPGKIYNHKKAREHILKGMKSPLPLYLHLVKREEWIRYRRWRDGRWVNQPSTRRVQMNLSCLHMTSQKEDPTRPLNVLDSEHLGFHGERYRYVEVKVLSLGVEETKSRKTERHSNSYAGQQTQECSISIGVATWDFFEGCHMGDFAFHTENEGQVLSVGLRSCGDIGMHRLLDPDSDLVANVGDVLGVGVDLDEKCIVLTKDGAVVRIVGCCRYKVCDPDNVGFVWPATLYDTAMENMEKLQFGVSVADKAAVEINGGAYPFQFDFEQWRNQQLQGVMEKEATLGPEALRCQKTHHWDVELNPVDDSTFEVSTFGDFTKIAHAVVDNALPSDLIKSLQQALDMLAEERFNMFRLGPECQLRDLVHPSFYPFVYSRSFDYDFLNDINRPGLLQEQNWDDYYLTGIRTHVASCHKVNQEPFASCIWPFTDMKVDNEDRVTFLSYINTLQKGAHIEVYTQLGRLFGLILPVFEQVLGVAETFISGDEESHAEPLSLRNMELQVAFSVVDYVLDPEEIYEGSWQYAGLFYEDIIAVGIYCFDEEYISDAFSVGRNDSSGEGAARLEDEGIEFRKATTLSGLEDENYMFPYCEDSEGEKKGYPGAMSIGCIAPISGKLTVFANNVQHKFVRLRNPSKTRTISRRVVTVYLRSTRHPLVSTRNIEDQTHSYLETVQLLDDLFNRGGRAWFGVAEKDESTVEPKSRATKRSGELTPEILSRIAQFAHSPGLSMRSALMHRHTILQDRLRWSAKLNKSLDRRYPHIDFGDTN